MILFYLLFSLLMNIEETLARSSRFKILVISRGEMPFAYPRTRRSIDIHFMCIGYNNSTLLLYYDHFDISIILLTIIDVTHAEQNQVVNCPTTTNVVQSP